MIKNRAQLLTGVSAEISQKRTVLLDIAEYALNALSPEALFKDQFFDRPLEEFDRVVVFSIGKAARAMGKAIVPLLQRRPSKILFAHEGHPLPTLKAVENTQHMIAEAKRMGEKDLAIVLISGGGSAMFACPVLEVLLSDQALVTQQLLKSGATIQEMNVVRKHLSQVKGGRFAQLLYPATVWGFVMSDVVGNDLSSIASGPISPDPSTFADALAVLKKYKITPPESVSAYLKKGLKTPALETAKLKDIHFKRVNVEIIADHKTVVEKAVEKAKSLGLRVVTVPKPLVGEARSAAKAFVQQAKKSTLLIAGGETTVKCVGSGTGGRNQEFVLSALRYLKDGQAILSLGTDGVDGVGAVPVAGAIGDFAIGCSAEAKGLDVESFLHENNSYEFFKQVSGQIKTGPTGTNLGDLVLLLA